MGAHRAATGVCYEASVRCIAMNPKRPTNLFAGTERGLYRSEDAGANWQYIDSALNPYYIWAIGIDPVNPDNMFVGTGTPTPAMLFRSKDGGRTWEKRPVEVAAECEAVGTPRFTGIAVDPVEPKNIWVSLEVDGARHSRDGGETWELVEVTGRKDIHNVAVPRDHRKPSSLWPIAKSTRAPTTAPLGKLEACRQVFPGSIREKKLTCAVSPLIRRDPKSILLGFGDFTPGSSGAIARSNDFGKSWKLLSLPVEPNSTVWTFGTNPADPNILFAASRYGLIFTAVTIAGPRGISYEESSARSRRCAGYQIRSSLGSRVSRLEEN